MYWLVDELVVGAYITHQHFLVSYLVSRTALLAVLSLKSVFQGKSINIGSLSLLSDARQRRNLESWLGGNGLVGEWVVSGCVQHTHQQNFSLLSHARQRKNLYYGGRVCARAGGGVV